MCGHVGVAGKLEYRDELPFKKMLIFDYFRGPDSTGAAALRKNGDTVLTKIASHPIDLFDTKKFAALLSGYQSSVFLGHNRFATKGKVNAVNAHPFQFEHIVGAHNGTLDRASWTRLEDAIGEKFDVDSAAIFAAFAKIGVEETIKLMTEGRTSNEGAWALVWFDLKDNSLNFLRNKHRPFWYAYSEDYDKVWWASEWPTIEAATKTPQNNQPAHKLAQSNEGYRFFQTKEDWWYRFDLEELQKKKTERPKPRVKEVKGKEPVVVYTAGNVTSPFPSRAGFHTPTGTRETSTTISPRGSNNLDVKELVGNLTNPLGGWISEDRFNELAKYGCSWCQCDVNYGDKGISVYESQQMILCSECSGNENDSIRVYVEPDKLSA